MKITPGYILERNRRNRVVHAANLPRGRGFSPLVGLFLEGAKQLSVCLMETASEDDAGQAVYSD